MAAPTVATIMGNLFVPGLLDRYLARTAYDGQQTSEPVESHRADNLFQPAPGHQGAHGGSTTRRTPGAWSWR